MADKNEKDKTKDYAIKALAGCTNPEGMRIRAISDRAQALGWETTAKYPHKAMGSTLRENTCTEQNPDAAFAKLKPGYFLLAESPVIGVAREKLEKERKAEAPEPPKEPLRVVESEGPVTVDTQVIVDLGNGIIDATDTSALNVDINENDEIVFIDDTGREHPSGISGAGIDESLREFMDGQFRSYIAGK